MSEYSSKSSKINLQYLQDSNRILNETLDLSIETANQLRENEETLQDIDSSLIRTNEIYNESFKELNNFTFYGRLVNTINDLKSYVYDDKTKEKNDVISKDIYSNDIEEIRRKVKEKKIEKEREKERERSSSNSSSPPSFVSSLFPSSCSSSSSSPPPPPASYSPSNQEVYEEKKDEEEELLLNLSKTLSNLSQMSLLINENLEKQDKDIEQLTEKVDYLNDKSLKLLLKTGQLTFSYDSKINIPIIVERKEKDKNIKDDSNLEDDIIENERKKNENFSMFSKFLTSISSSLSLSSSSSTSTQLALPSSVLYLGPIQFSCLNYPYALSIEKESLYLTNKLDSSSIFDIFFFKKYNFYGLKNRRTNKFLSYSLFYNRIYCNRVEFSYYSTLYFDIKILQNDNTFLKNNKKYMITFQNENDNEKNKKLDNEKDKKEDNEKETPKISTGILFMASNRGSSGWLAYTSEFLEDMKNNNMKESYRLYSTTPSVYDKDMMIEFVPISTSLENNNN